MKRNLFASAMAIFLLAFSASAEKVESGEPGVQWSVEKAMSWYNGNPWFCGVNYIPAYALNYTAMWDKTTFDPKAIDAELALMEETGMNCARVVLQYAVWEDDAKYFKRVFKKFLALCDNHNIKVMPIFFDDCVFGVNTDPKVGDQGEPLKGWYAWAWSPSPGRSMVYDERTHWKLEKYVKDIMTAFKDDDRIMLWDLYNEPSSDSWTLLRSVFKWAREVNPSQPISTCMWKDDAEYDSFLNENCDVLTFHCYAGREHTLNTIKRINSFGRPVICTEWMNRVQDSCIRNCLDLFLDNDTGCMLWGLVNGKTQTELPWGHRPEMGEWTGPWQHDIYHGDHTPYDPEEIVLLKETIERADKR